MEACACACPSAVHHTAPPPLPTIQAHTSSCFHRPHRFLRTSFGHRLRLLACPTCARILWSQKKKRKNVTSVLASSRSRCRGWGGAPEPRFVLVQTDAVAGISWGEKKKKSRRLWRRMKTSRLFVYVCVCVTTNVLDRCSCSR